MTVCVGYGSLLSTQHVPPPTRAINAQDGVDLLPLVASSPTAGDEEASSNPVVRPKPLGFSCTGGEQAVIDHNWKLLHNPKMGQCTPQLPYSSWSNLSSVYLLFDLDKDYNELHDLSHAEPAQFRRMRGLLDQFLASVENSQANETRCGKFRPPPPPPSPPWVEVELKVMPAIGERACMES